MKNIFTYSICFLLTFFTLISSNIMSQVNISKCGAAELHDKLLLTDPAYAQRMQDYESFVQNFQQQQKTTSVVYKIPVVVHVMHKGEAIGIGTNITDQAIYDAIKDLNEKLRKIPGTQGDGNGVDVEIEYSLAARDPSGNCTNAINRVDMTSYAAYMSNGVDYTSTGGMPDASLKAVISWDQTKYYNMWLVSEIDNNNGGAGWAGYAYFASSHGTPPDGAIMMANQFTNPSSATLIHELGHSLNLYHTFEGDATGSACPTATNGCGSGAGDCCGDIPAHIRSSSDCVTGTNACDGITARDLFIHNYMDYSSDICKNMYTANQKTRMIAALTGIRASFLSPENGGTNMSLVPPSTAGVAFKASSSILCGVGQTVDFSDMSSCVPNSYLGASAYLGITYSWTATNGTNVYTSSLQNPSITFTNTGTFTVSLSVTTSFGTTSLTNPSMIIVTSGAPVAGCIPGSSNVGNFWQTVNNVTFNSFSSSTSQYTNTAYTDLSCTDNTTLTAGSSYSLSISTRANSGNEAFEVYIDYNNNGIFTNPSEMIFSGLSTTSTTATYTTNIVIPGTAVQNTLLRMRVIGESGTISVSERTCGVNLFIGDVEDYGVYINPTSCTAPSITSTSPSSRCGSGTLTIGATASTGTVSWYTAATGGTAIATGTVYTTPSLTSTTTYYVDATSAGCTTPTRTAVNATINATPILTLTPTTATICSGLSTTLTVSGASTYTWAPSGSGTSSILSPTTTTIYTVSGTSAAGCVSTPKTSTINVNTIPTLTLTPATATICSGLSTTLTVSGASTYTWAPSGSGTSSVVSPTATIVYTVSGTSAAGCISAPKTSTVTVNTTPTITLTPGTATICSGLSTTLTVSGASTYTWAPSGSGTSSVVSPTTTIVYTVSGTSAAGCVSAPKMSTVTVNSKPTTTASTTGTLTCSSLTVALNSSLAGMNYTWTTPSGGSVSTPNTQNTNGTGPGIYTLSVVNPATGCTYSTTTSVSQNTTTPSVTGSTSGALTCSTLTTTATAATTTTPVSYVWSGTGIVSGSATATILVNQPGTFNYTVTSTVNGCKATGSQGVTQNISVPTVSISGSQTITCAAPTVTLTGSAIPSTCTPVWTGGVSSGATSYTATASSSNTYTLTITNPSNGCVASATTQIVPSAGVPSVSMSVTNSLTCTSLTAQIVATTTSSPVTYNWSGPGIVSGATTSSATVNAGGQYTVVVTNTLSGCSSTITASVNQNTTVPSVSGTTSGTLTCTALTVNANATTTVTPVSYSWSGTGIVSGISTGTVTVNQPGSYNYTVTNTSNGCAAVGIRTVTQNTVTPSVTTSTSGTLTCSTITASAIASTATSPVNYNWTGAGIVSGAATGTITVNQGGSYNYTVTNAVNGCSVNGSQSISQNTISPTLTLSPLSSSICSGSSQTLSVTTSGSNMILWNTGAGTASISVTPTITVNYSVTVTNTINGCSAAKNATVTVNSTPTISASPSGTTICNGSNTSCTLTGACTYTWMPGGFTGAINNLSPTSNTTYTAIGSCGGCNSVPQTVVINVSQNPIVSSTVTNVSCFGICDGATTITATGGTGPYTFSVIQGTPICAATTCTNLCAGAYSIDVTDANGCSDNSTIFISQPTQLVATTSSTNASCSSCSDGAASVLASGGTPVYTFNWSNGSTMPNPGALLFGCYTVTVTDVNGCMDVRTTCISFGTKVAEIQTTNNNLTIFPNPSNGIFTISSSVTTDKFEITVINTLGQTVKTETLKNSNQTSIDMSTMSKGVYYLKAASAEGTKLFKLILE